MFNGNTNIFIQKKALENVVYRQSSIFIRSHFDTKAVGCSWKLSLCKCGRICTVKVSRGVSDSKNPAPEIDFAWGLVVKLEMPFVYSSKRIGIKRWVVRNHIKSKKQTTIVIAQDVATPNMLKFVDFMVQCIANYQVVTVFLGN